ncbi:MAG TPA: 50S ribosomal protein L4 [Steroidobacteraceae bacterium]
MSEVQVHSQSGETAGSVTLDDSVFGTQVNVPVMHQVVVAQLAAARAGTHSTKRRGEVSGGGRKPWRQKGTGRARQGSTRAPHWTGGGVVFGPRSRDHSMKVPKKMRALALRSALSDRAAGGTIAVVDKWEFPAPSAKAAKALLDAIGVKGSSLIVFDAVDEAAVKSFRNLVDVHLILASQINTYDVLAADWIVFTKAALEQVVEARKAEPSRREKAAAAARSETKGGEQA